MISRATDDIPRIRSGWHRAPTAARAGGGAGALQHMPSLAADGRIRGAAADGKASGLSAPVISMAMPHLLVADKHECPVCGRMMTEIQVCHLLCRNCGAVLDCSDKGVFW